MNADEIVKFDREKSDAIFTETLNDLDTLNTRDGSFEYADYVALHNDVTALYDSFSYVDELIESLRAQLTASQRRERAAVDTLTKLLKHANDDDDICAYCNNQIICNGKSCESYREGVGDVDGNYPDWEWTCEDFDYGTCFKMQNTPCNGCFDNEYSGFEWRGPQDEEGGAE